MPQVCQKPLCNGEAHGVGVCEYEHLWVQKSYTAATATTVGHSVAECMTCGIVNERVFPCNRSMEKGFIKMSKGKFDIKSILDIPRWEAVQDQLAKATGTAIITIHYKGTPITKHSMRTDFCSIIRENPISCKRSRSAIRSPGWRRYAFNQPNLSIYLCHCGIVDVAVPITVGDQYLGAVMFGPVRMSNGSDAGVERLVNEISAVHTDDAVSALQPDLRELYQRLPEMEYDAYAVSRT